MPGKLAFDFGTSNTLVAVWNETRQEAEPIAIPDFGRLVPQAGEQIPVIPSLIHYGEQDRRWIGNQVLAQNLYRSPATFRWMKRYISNRSMIQRRVNGRQVSHFDAGRDFLSSVLVFAANERNLAGEEVGFSVPVEAFEHYENWLATVAESAGMPRFRLIDEPSAAALGYGASIQPGDVYLIFDFGGGTLHSAVVLMEETEQAVTGRRCRVLGKAGADLGGSTIDQWLYREVLRQNGRDQDDEAVRAISTMLLVECERAKERLSGRDSAEIIITNPENGDTLSAEINRSRFEEILEEKGAFTRISQTVRRALTEAHDRGYKEENIKSVLMVGGSSQIPSVQSSLRRTFGRDRVQLHRPLDAVVRGAAAFVAGVDFYDHIQHDYAIRTVNPRTGEEQYRVIVERGTPYPTHEPLACLAVKATYDGQTHLGISIYEMAEQLRSGPEREMEIVFDPTGAARVREVSVDEEEHRARFWMNEGNPTFLVLDQPAQRGERCFRVQFSIDENKRLLITARDIDTDRLTHRDYPVVRLV